MSPKQLFCYFFTQHIFGAPSFGSASRKNEMLFNPLHTLRAPRTRKPRTVSSGAQHGFCCLLLFRFNGGRNVAYA